MNLLNKNEKIEINVHFIISEPLNSYCVALNCRLNKCDKGLLHMKTGSIILPHLSLFMGYIDSYQMLENVFAIVEKYAQNTMSFRLDATHVYDRELSLHGLKYVFIDILQNEYITEQKHELKRLLEDRIIPLDCNVESERPHITVGYYKKFTPIMNEILEEQSVLPSCLISQIGISIVGKSGVCLGLLKAFELGY